MPARNSSKKPAKKKATKTKSSKTSSKKTSAGKKKTASTAASKKKAPAKKSSTKKSAAKKSPSRGKKSPAQDRPVPEGETREYTPDDLDPFLLDGDDMGGVPFDDDGSRRVQQVRSARERFRTATQNLGKQKVGLGTGLVHGIFNRVRKLQQQHPELAVELELNEWKIRQRLRNIRSLLDAQEFAEEDRELFIVLVVNYVQKMCEEILIDPQPPVEPEPPAAVTGSNSGKPRASFID